MRDHVVIRLHYRYIYIPLGILIERLINNKLGLSEYCNELDE